MAHGVHRLLCTLTAFCESILMKIASRRIAFVSPFQDGGGGGKSGGGGKQLLKTASPWLDDDKEFIEIGTLRYSGTRYSMSASAKTQLNQLHYYHIMQPQPMFEKTCATTQTRSPAVARDGRPYFPSRKTNQTIVLSKTQYYYRNEIIQKNL